MSPADWGAAADRTAHRLARASLAIEARLRAPSGILARRPTESGAWSALETAEHAALVNHHLLLLVEKIAERARKKRSEGVAPPAEVSPIDDLEKLSARSFAWESPEHMLPAGLATAPEIARALAGQRRRCLALLREMRDGTGALHAISMSVVGSKLDLYQYAALIALHMERHVRQMDRAMGAG